MASDITAPPNVTFDSIVTDAAFHPNKNVFACGFITGEVLVNSYSTNSNSAQLMKFTHHKKSCRTVRFSDTGEMLFTASKDKSLRILDMNEGRLQQTINKAHNSPLSTLLVIDGYLLATGDEDGSVILWDFRREKAVMTAKHSEEFISAFVMDAEKRTLLATSGEGTLTAFDIRKKEMAMQSELLDSELLSAAVMKDGSKVVCGSGEGVLQIFNWGEWGNISDRFPGHPMSVDAMVAIDDKIMCTGSMDGIIRAVSILPNRILDSVGTHGDFPVERLHLCREKKWLASCSHDETVKFWSVAHLVDMSNEYESKKDLKRKKTAGQHGKSNKKDHDFFSGLT